MDVAMIGLLAGTGWASGQRLYLVVVLLGGSGRLGLVDVPEALTRTDVLVGAGALLIVEFLVDKMPYFDSLWDVVHTVIRPLGAGLLGVLLTGDAASWEQGVAALTTGGVATLSHAAKAAHRAAANSSPEPVSNVTLSLFEDGLVLGVIGLAIVNPVLALVIVIILLVFGITAAVLALRLARRGFRRIRERWRRHDCRSRPHRDPSAGP